MHTDTINSVFVFNLKGENKMLHVELTDKNISSFFKVYATDKEVGLLLNFGRTPEFNRVIFTNDRKE